MFNTDTCRRCGACLVACPFVKMSKQEAKREIVRLVDQGRNDFVLKTCSACGYCDYICPAQSNPSHLRKSILQAHFRETGVGALRIISDKVPFSIMSAGLETEKREKLERLAALTNPGPVQSGEVFYLGCALSYIYTDLAQSPLFQNLPAVGGMKYCCGAYAWHTFGEKEARAAGRRLLSDFDKAGIKRVITFCPECEDMLARVYPSLIEGFDIKTRSVTDYLWEEYLAARLLFTHPVNKTVAFHDPCAGRTPGCKQQEVPRQLLKAMGAKVVEMKHNREKTICCGTPLVGRNSSLAARVASERVLEAVDAGADTIAVGCAGCFALDDTADVHNMETYHIIELVQMAAGDKPPHRIKEVRAQLIDHVLTRIAADPALMTQKYVLENGHLRALEPQPPL